MADEESEYISVVQAVKLIAKSFDGNPEYGSPLLAFPN
jgi:hypothetical protein